MTVTGKYFVFMCFFLHVFLYFLLAEILYFITILFLKSTEKSRKETKNALEICCDIEYECHCAHYFYLKIHWAQVFVLVQKLDVCISKRVVVKSTKVFQALCFLKKLSVMCYRDKITMWGLAGNYFQMEILWLFLHLVSTSFCFQRTVGFLCRII